MPRPMHHGGDGRYQTEVYSDHIHKIDFKMGHYRMSCTDTFIARSMTACLNSDAQPLIALAHPGILSSQLPATVGNGTSSLGLYFGQSNAAATQVSDLWGMHQNTHPCILACTCI